MRNAFLRRGIFIAALVSGVTSCTPPPPTVPPVIASARITIDCNSSAQVSAHEIHGMPILVVCRSHEDLANLKKLNQQVFDLAPESPFAANYRAVRMDVFVVVAVSPYSKCKVDFVPRVNNQQGWSPQYWFGGFHSPCHSEVFDLAGRQIRPGPFSPTKFPKFIGNLPIPNYRFISENEIEIIKGT